MQKRFYKYPGGVVALTLNVMSILEQHGWCLYGSVDQLTEEERKHTFWVESDTWHFRRVKGWQVGMAVQ